MKISNPSETSKPNTRIQLVLQNIFTNYSNTSTSNFTLAQIGTHNVSNPNT